MNIHSLPKRKTIDHLSHAATSDDADNQYRSDLTEDNADQVLFKCQPSFSAQTKTNDNFNGLLLFPSWLFFLS